MTKAQRLKAQRLLLETYITTNPQIKTLLDTLIEKENVEQVDVVKPIIEEELKRAKMIGTNIGWQTAFLRCEEAIEDMSDVQEIKAYVSGEANKVRETLGIKGGNDEREDSKS